MINNQNASKRREELSRRLDILMDVVVAEGGQPYKFADIQSALAAKGVGLEAQLKLLKAMRIAEVRSFAARALGDLSPEATEAIAKILEDEMKSTD